MSSSNLFVIKSKVCLLILLAFSSFIAQAQDKNFIIQPENKHFINEIQDVNEEIEENQRHFDTFYSRLFVNIGFNTWQVKETKLTMRYVLSSNDLINSIQWVNPTAIAPHVNLGFELGRTQQYFIAFNAQFAFTKIVGSYFDLSGGFNIPIMERKMTLQIGSGIFYQAATIELDSRKLTMPISINGERFDVRTLTTSFIDNNFGIRPLVALTIPISETIFLRIASGYQINLFNYSRIRFSQVKPRPGRNSYIPSYIKAHSDIDRINFQINDERVSQTPFRYSGFFLNIGLTWDWER